MDVSSFLLQSGAVASISLTITRSKLFKPVQKHELFKCPYCFSHWTAWVLTATSKTPRSTLLPPVDFMVYWFALVAGAALIMGVIMRLFLSQESKIEELESDLEQATDLLKKLDTGVLR